MIKRHILTRITRLGMAMYAFFWCMSFTVCASDHPLADLAAAEYASALTSAGEEAIIDETGPDVPAESVETPGENGEGGGIESDDETLVGNETIAIPETAADNSGNNSSETVPYNDTNTNSSSGETVPYNDTNTNSSSGEVVPVNPLPAGGSDNNNEFRLKDSSITLYLPAAADDTIKFELKNGNYGFEIDPSKLFYNVYSDESGSNEGVSNVTISNDGTLDLSQKKSGDTFWVGAYYKPEAGEMIKTPLCKVVVVVYPTNLQCKITPEGSPEALATPSVDVRENIAFSIDVNDTTGYTLDARMVNWTIKNNGVDCTANIPEGITFTPHGLYSNITFDLDKFKDISNITVTAVYSCGIPDAPQGQGGSYESDTQNAEASFYLNSPDDSSVEFITLDKDRLMIDDFSETYSLSASDYNNKSDLNPSKLSFVIQNISNGKETEIEGVTLQKNGTSVLLNVSGVRETTVFNVTALYTLSNGSVTRAKCMVFAQLIAKEIALDVKADEKDAANNKMITVSKSGTKVDLYAKCTDPSSAKLDPSKASWTIEGASSTMAFNSSDFPGESYIDPDDPLHAVLVFNNVTQKDKYIVGISYDNSYINCFAENVTKPSATFYTVINLDPAATTDKITAIKLSNTNVTITEPGKNITINTLVKSGSGKIDPARLSYSVLDENGAPLDNRNISVTKIENSTKFVISTSPYLEPIKFYVNATYINSNGASLDANCVVVVNYVSQKLSYVALSYGSATKTYNGLYITGADGLVNIYPKSLKPEFYALTADRISWKITEDGKVLDAGALSEKGIELEIDQGKAYFSIKEGMANVSARLNVSMTYNNTYVDAKGVTQKPKNQETSCIVTIDTRPVIDLLEAHLPEQAATVQLYKTNNSIPFALRFTDFSRINYFSDISATDIEFKPASSADSELAGMLNVSIRNQNEININLKDSLIGSETAVNTLIKKKSIKGSFLITVESTDDEKVLETKNITLKIGATKPTVKAAGTLVFDSYLTGNESHPINFTGANVTGFEFVDAEAAAKSGLYKDSEYPLNVKSFTGLPAKTGKKTVKVVAFISDSEYRLPSSYNVTVPVSYMVKNGAPTLKLNSTSIVLNKFTDISGSEFAVTGCTLSGSESSINNTNISFEIYDSKNKKPISDGLAGYYQPFELKNGTLDGVIALINSTGTILGQTYKVRVYPYNIYTNVKGAATVLTVKVLAEKDADNVSLSIKGKGTLDACNPNTQLNLTLTGKNINTLMLIPRSVKIFVNGTDVTEYFHMPTSHIIPGPIEISEKTSFALLKDGLAGKTATCVVDFGPIRSDSDKQLNATYSFKIGKSTVSAKPNPSSVSYNPVYNEENVTIPITNLPGGIYDYAVNISCGRDSLNSKIQYEVLKGNPKDECDEIRIGLDDLDPALIKNLAGKTISVKITPVAPEERNVTLPAKTSTFSIKVLNPARSKASITAKAKGNLDAIRDNTNTTITVSYKNMLTPYDALEELNCTIFRQTKQGNFTYNNCFNVYWDPDSDNINSLVITRKNGSTIEAGTYKALISATVYTDDEDKLLTTTTTFKVVRGGKTGAVLSPATGKITNRVNGQPVASTVEVKDKNVNAIDRIMIGGNGKYNTTFVLVPMSGSNSFAIIRRPDSIEMSKNKPIVKAVTKTIPVEVYYRGSNVPDKINFKITINP